MHREQFRVSGQYYEPSNSYDWNFSFGDSTLKIVRFDKGCSGDFSPFGETWKGEMKCVNGASYAVTLMPNPSCTSISTNLSWLGFQRGASELPAAVIAQNAWVPPNGEPPDYPKALKYWRIAASEGNPRAMANVGWIYENGFGLQRDCAQAMEWYKKAVNAGDITAL